MISSMAEARAWVAEVRDLSIFPDVLVIITRRDNRDNEGGLARHFALAAAREITSEPEPFTVTDEMYEEIANYASQYTYPVTHAVVYPDSDVSDGWDYMTLHSAEAAEFTASRHGPDAVVIAL